MTTPGDRIKNLRENLRITQTRLAEEIGVSSRVMSSIELNKQGVTNEQLISLSEFFNVSVDYILTGKESVLQSISPIEEEIIQAVREDNALLNTLKEAIELKKKVMSQIKRLSQRSLEEHHLEHA